MLDTSLTDVNIASPVMADAKEDTVLPVPAVTALKDAETAQAEPAQGQMQRSMSQDIQEESEDLKEAAAQTLNVILDVGLDGVVRWASASWEDVVGTSAESVRGKPIADILVDNKSAFANAVESMKKDDSRSRRVRFSVQMGPLSKLAEDPVDAAIHAEEEGFRPEEIAEEANLLALEGQGIMVYDRSSGGESHVSDPAVP